MVISVVISALVFPFVGLFIDKCDVIRLMPVAFIFRFVTALIFMKIDDPDSYTCLTVCVLLIIGTIFENSVIDTIFAKSIPKEARGILTCLQGLVGSTGILVFSFLSGYMYDHISNKAPFAFIGFLDFAFASTCIIFTFK